MNNILYYIDVSPIGWRYGFPKLAPNHLMTFFKEEEPTKEDWKNLKKWVVEEGYPLEKVKAATYRFFAVKE